MRFITVTAALCFSLALPAAAEPNTVQIDSTTATVPLEVGGIIPDQLFLSTYQADSGGGSMSGDLYTTFTLSNYNPWNSPLEASTSEVISGDTLSSKTGWQSSFNNQSGESLTAWLAWVQQVNECINRRTVVIFDGDPSTSEQHSLASGVYYAGFRWIGDDEETRYGWVAFEFERMPYSGTHFQSCSFYEEIYSELIEPTFRYIAVGWESEPDTQITAGGGLCAGDFNFDAQVNFFDVSDFINAFSSQQSSADLNDDGAFNFFDISEFLGRMNQDCEY